MYEVFSMAKIFWIAIMIAWWVCAKLCVLGAPANSVNLTKAQKSEKLHTLNKPSAEKLSPEIHCHRK